MSDDAAAGAAAGDSERSALHRAGFMVSQPMHELQPAMSQLCAALAASHDFWSSSRRRQTVVNAEGVNSCPDTGWQVIFNVDDASGSTISGDHTRHMVDLTHPRHHRGAAAAANDQISHAGAQWLSTAAVYGEGFRTVDAHALASVPLRAARGAVAAVPGADQLLHTDMDTGEILSYSTGARASLAPGSLFFSMGGCRLTVVPRSQALSRQVAELWDESLVAVPNVREDILPQYGLVRPCSSAGGSSRARGAVVPATAPPLHTRSSAAAPAGTSALYYDITVSRRVAAAVAAGLRWDATPRDVLRVLVSTGVIRPLSAYTVDLPPLTFAFFRGGFAHGGVGYQVLNFRLHWYVVSSSDSRSGLDLTTNPVNNWGGAGEGSRSVHRCRECVASGAVAGAKELSLIDAEEATLGLRFASLIRYHCRMHSPDARTATIAAERSASAAAVGERLARARQAARERSSAGSLGGAEGPSASSSSSVSAPASSSPAAEDEGEVGGA